jgi:hypothetical protein
VWAGCGETGRRRVRMKEMSGWESGGDEDDDKEEKEEEEKERQ